jgi:hypothetical protein
MPIVGSDIVLRLSVKTGSAGDSTAGTPAGSLGKYVSQTAMTNATLSNLFDQVSGAEASAGDTEYRCVFILNNHATLTLEGCQVSIQSETSGGANIAIALDNIGASAKGSSSAQAAEITDEQTAPSGVSAFGTSALTLGNIGPGQVRAVWLRRTVPASTAAINLDGVVLAATGETEA